MRELNPFDGRLYLIIGPDHVAGDLEALVRAALKGGITALQLRDKGSETAALVSSARALMALLKGTGVPLIVNDRVDVAREAGADGVHLGASDMAPAEARRLIGPNKILGITVKKPHEADAVDPAVIDYASIGGVFETMSKNNPDPPVGLDGLAALRGRIRAVAPEMPVTAIAGIDERRASSVIKAGADGIAVISAITRASDPEAAARALRANVDFRLRANQGGSRPAPSKTPIALTIAGSDSGGGAGVQADLKAFSALGVYGASVITALTAQNTLAVEAIHPVDPIFIRQQMAAVLTDIDVKAIKIGMLGTPDVVRAVRAGLDDFNSRPIVLDPVMVAKSGDPLLAEEAVQSLKDALIGIAEIITPNLPEAARLIGVDAVDGDRPAMEAAAKTLLDLGPFAVLLKGGHGTGGDCDDLYLDRDGTHFWMTGKRVDTGNTHGTGCTLSASIAAGLAKGLSLTEAVKQAKTYIADAISAADELDIGAGHGPVHHFHAFRRT